MSIVRAANQQGVLTGEEVSVSFGDVVALPERFQLSHYATNFGSHLFYWAAWHLDPSADLFYGRWWKATAMALLAPLVYLILRKRLACNWFAALIGGTAVCLIPGVASFMWLATENGLETVVGMVGLFLASSRRPLWRVSPLIGCVAVSMYGSGLAWLSVIGLLCLWRVFQSQHRQRDAWVLSAASLLGIVMVLFPLLWWDGGTIVTGGGEVQLSQAGAHLGQLGNELFVAGTSYYYFTSQAALGPLPVVFLSGLGLVWGTVWRRQVLPWFGALLATAALYTASGGVLGVRRAIAICVIGGIGVGLVADLLYRLPVWAWLNSCASVDVGAGRRVRSIGAVLMTACVLIPLAGGIAVSCASLSDGTNTGKLPVDFVFPIEPKQTMLSTLAAVARQRDAHVSWAQIARQREGARTASLLLLLQGESGIPNDVVTGAQVEQLYRQGSTCDTRCEPIPGQK